MKMEGCCWAQVATSVTRGLSAPDVDRKYHNFAEQRGVKGHTSYID